MFVRDIIEQASVVTGLNNDAGPTGLYNALTDAIEVLSNKANWDPMQGYLDIIVIGNTVILPRQVEYPIKININSTPSFSRDKLYEFIMNGPGNDMSEVSNTNWMDKGTVPVMVELTSSDVLLAVSTNPADDGKTIIVIGNDANGLEMTETLTLNLASSPVTTGIFQTITHVSKQATLGSVNLIRSLEGAILSKYAPNETYPEYRKIVLSVSAPALRILYRRLTTKITSDNDFIPLHSKFALLLTLKALEYYKVANTENGDKLMAAAVGFIKDEQDSLRNFSLIDQTESQSIMDLNITSPGVMLVSDIYDQACEIVGNIGRQKVFDRITDAIDRLSNKMQIDSMLRTVNVVANGNIVTLPADVNAPIKVTINNEPSFSRDRTFEYTMNSSGIPDGENAGFAFMDQGEVNTMVPISGATPLYALCGASDDGKFLRVFGRDENGVEVFGGDGLPGILLTMSDAEPDSPSATIAYIDGIQKDVTVGTVALKTGATVLATYLPNEVRPVYRQIRITKPASAVKILYQTKTPRISALTDVVPMQSRGALLLMMKANQVSGTDTKAAQQYEEMSEQAAKEEQESRNSYAELAKATEDQPCADLNYNNADSIIVSDIYDDAGNIFGRIGKHRLFDAITESVEILNNLSIWDGLDGYVDICTANSGVVTLPRYVETPIAINIGGHPRQFRNKWFEFHLNGPGTYRGCSWEYVDNIGDSVVTFLDVAYPQQLVAIPDSSADNGLELRVYGYHDSKWFITDGVDGFPVTMMAGNTVPSLVGQLVDRITRITKPVTAGYVMLKGFDANRNKALTIGYYYPDETEPNYARIKIDQGCQWIRMRYRKRTLKVTSLTDPLHLKSKLAIVMAMHSMKAYKDKNYEAAKEAKQEALELLSAEQASRNPTATFDFQFNTGISMADPMIIT